MAKQQRVWARAARPAARRPASRSAAPTQLSPEELRWLDAWFMERVFPVLTPLAIDPAHPFPFIPNMGLVMALQLLRDEDDHAMRALIPLPARSSASSACPAMPGDRIRFVMLEDLVGAVSRPAVPRLPRHRAGHVPPDPRHRCGVRGRGGRPRALLRERAEAPPPRRADPSRLDAEMPDDLRDARRRRARRAGGRDLPHARHARPRRPQAAHRR